MTNYSFTTNRARGFSLIEVLIAVLVLATGMLALAALQANITRNSVDAKVRSQGLAIAVDVLDRVRARASASVADYRSLPSGTTAWTRWAPPTSFGTVNQPAEFDSRSTVTRYVRESTTAGCGGVAANAPCFRPATVADDYRLSTVAEYKTVTSEVRWTGDDGTVRTVSVNDVLTSVTRDKSSALLNQLPTPPVSDGAPIARIDKPSDAGIIPIAIGGGRETAASNPKPILGYERGRTDETEYQVYTYGVDRDGAARLSRLIDTRVVGCRCERGDLPETVANNSAIELVENAFFRTPKQPTYWNGKDYAEPQDGLATVRGVPIESADQNQDLCVTCCLDHHDANGQTAKFDSVRSADPLSSEPIHLHYGDADNDGALDPDPVTAVGGDYFEVCRMIRVNGYFRTATDSNLKFMNLLETDPTSTTESLPAATPRTRYQALVKDVVDQLIVSGASSPNVSAYSDILVDPAEITLSGVGSRRFLHNRGLYVDFLEADARQAVADARADCPNGTPIIDCVLPIIPFVSINTTGIGQWDSTNQQTISVNNLARTASPDPRAPPAPRGLTTGLADGVSETGSVFMQLSNSGLSDSYGIDPADVSQVSRDTQLVTVTRVGGPPAGGRSLAFPANSISGIDPDLISIMGITTTDATDTNAQDCQKATTGRDRPYPVSCTTLFDLPAVTKLRLRYYNKEITVRQSTCGRNQNVFTCPNLAVSAVTVNSVPIVLVNGTNYVVSNNGTSNEDSVVTLGSVRSNDQLGLTFRVEAATRVATHTCSGSTINYTYSPACSQ